MFRLDGNERLLIGLTLTIKVAVLVLGVVAWQLVRGGEVNFPALELWDRWDAPHYTDIIVYGYRAVDSGNLVDPYGYRQVYPGDLGLYIVFYPLFPWLGTVVNAVLHEPVWSAFIVSGIASLFVAPLMYRLVRQDESPDLALRSAWFLLIFPTAYFLHIGYTEALFMALVIGSFLAARTDRWWLAGLLGGLAALTRINGLVLLLALPVEAATQWYMQPPGERRFRWAWLAIGLVGVGFAIYLALNYALYGTPFQFLHVQQEHWFKSLASPVDAINSAFGWFESSEPDNRLMYGFMELLFVAIGFAGTIVAAVRFRPSWFAWMAGNLVLFVSTSFLLSTPRYALTLFPLFVALALPTRRTWLLVAVSALSIAGFIYFAS
ncbi:MAG TPA: glycosyltransferase 87 family protein, partial [Candidatus Limnocylindrales bacterium]|nr:glycosyltransferase 87 family protein [Candidatus Limnocylindrales bacterium]